MPGWGNIDKWRISIGGARPSIEVSSASCVTISRAGARFAHVATAKFAGFFAGTAIARLLHRSAEQKGRSAERSPSNGA
jgi:hypothetical protein